MKIITKDWHIEL